MRSTSHHLQQLMASSSSSSNTPKLEYEVFLSFHGEDTRQNFTSHLYEAFCKKKIKTFIDDKLNRGEEISPSLLKAIEHSKISVIIFSKRYASSRWCLKELEEIVKCKNTYDQIVIPVFYDVDPSHVRNQTGVFGEAFAELEKRFMDDSEMLQRWRTALRDAANISGYDSKNSRNETTLIKDLVNDVWKKLDYNSSIIPSKYLVGLESSIEEIENLLCSKGVCKLGIWGIGGIGKTTLADAIFKKISKQFEESYFISNIREESENSGGLNDLCQKLSSAVLGDEHPNHRFTFTRRSLISRKKVLIVFDDVTKLKQMQCLMAIFGELDSYSRIIITSRDKHVLKNCEVDRIHEMTLLSPDDAFQLFELHAFRGNSPTADYTKLSYEVVAYVEGLPLALEVLGSFLFTRTKGDWESALEKLKTRPYGDVQKVLKISYEGLDGEYKRVFLDIACFFKGCERDFVEAILKACGLNPRIYIKVLIERCLITTSFDTITMHDLLEQMGREIVRQESIDNPGERSHLWDHEDIFSVLKNNTGTRAIRSICLDMSKVEKLHLDPEAFNNMQNLRFLKFYGFEHGKNVPESNSSALLHILRWLKRENSNDGKVHGFEKLKFDFHPIRYFCFHGYPDKSLPSNFNPKNLVALYMPNSKVEKLWTGNQVLVNLKHIDLSDSKHLRRIPDLSLMPNLESLELDTCTNLLESFSSIHNLHKLVILNLQGCKSLKNLSISDSCQSLRQVFLSGCSNLETIQYLPDTVEELYLNNTAIKELLSIEHLFRLEMLNLENCSRLERLPNSIRELKSLKELYLLNCSKLDRLPNDIGNLQTLEHLLLEDISFVEIPPFITSLINLETLGLSRCNMQKRFGIPLVDFSVFQRLSILYLIDCRLEVLPNGICKLLSLFSLDLSGNDFQTLPESIKDLSNLRDLWLRNCQRLKDLPKLPRSLRVLHAMNCISLESISSLLDMNCLLGTSDFINCFKLKLDMTNLALIIGRSADALCHRFDIKYELQTAKIVYPGGRIPKFFDLKSNESFIKFPEGWAKDNLIGFIICVVVSSQDDKLNVGFRLIVNGKMIFSDYLIDSWPVCLKFPKGEEVIELDHVVIGFQCLHMFEAFSTLNLNSQGGIEFFVEHATKNGEVRNQVKKCGVTLLYAKNDGLRRVKWTKMKKDLEWWKLEG
ncbi:disease resistance protein RPP2B-like [Mangifera indica]|uniref:disease resistance protein RPP2B-like n=1 Tax=Mangifera indica TaxID=29780 RepID=UPI001CFA5D3A|nr:disease resistance protein RPP2B-like [Mangifera indica]XP_044470073.1 disease resistance protein RPP2B-like [Mangifera indica]XP_044470074.1 disease resistance protein RPP2B-like [Mangifera indica]